MLIFGDNAPFYAHANALLVHFNVRSLFLFIAVALMGDYRDSNLRETIAA